MTDDETSRHDLQNQIAIIGGFAELLLIEADATDPRRPDFEHIHDAAQTALTLLARVYPIDTDTPQ